MGNSFFSVVLPLLLCVAIYYGYHAGGFFSDGIKVIVDPILRVIEFEFVFKAVFGIEV